MQLAQRVYLIDGGRELALVDAGTGLGVAEIVDNIRAHGFDLGHARYFFPGTQAGHCRL